VTSLGKVYDKFVIYDIEAMKDVAYKRQKL